MFTLLFLKTAHHSPNDQFRGINKLFKIRGITIDFLICIIYSSKHRRVRSTKIFKVFFLN